VQSLRVYDARVSPHQHELPPVRRLGLDEDRLRLDEDRLGLDDVRLGLEGARLLPPPTGT